MRSMQDEQGAIPDNAASRPPQTRRVWLILIGLAAILTLALVLRLELFVGLMGSDDMVTYILAKALSEGHLAPEHIFHNAVASTRFGPAIPTALVFRVLGITSATVMVYPIAISLLAIVVVWDLVRRFTGSIWCAHAAALVPAVCGLDIHYSTVALPDAPMVAVSLCALWCVVVGCQREGRTTWWRCLLLFAAGLLAAFAVMHKEAAIQLVGAMGLWGLLLLVTRRFRPALLLIAAGFIVGTAGELLLFHEAYGDALFRWKLTLKYSAMNAARTQEMADRSLPYAARMWSTLRKLYTTMPAFSLVTGLGVVAALTALIRYWRRPGVLLITLYFLSAAALRPYEQLHTYSYQPRRYLPLIGAAAILLALLLPLARRRRWLATSLAVVFLGGYGYLFANGDARTVRISAHPCVTEEWLFDWTKQHADLVRENGLYADHRTCQALYMLHGLKPLSELGIFCSDQGEDDPFLGPQPTEFREGAFFFDSPRWQDHLIKHDQGTPFLMQALRIPATWPLVMVANHERRKSSNAGMYQIRRRPTDAAERRADEAWCCNWHAIGAPGVAPVVAVTSEGIEVTRVEFTQGDALSLVSARRPVTWSGSSPPTEYGDWYLRLAVPLRATPNSDEPIAASMALYGEDEARQLVSVGEQEFEVGADWRWFVADMNMSPDARSVHAALRLTGRGVYEVGPGRLITLARAERQRDIGFTGPDQPGENVYHGWRAKVVQGPPAGTRLAPAADLTDFNNRLVLDMDPRCSVELRRNVGASETEDGELLCRRGEYLVLSVPLHTAIDSLPQDSISVRMLVVGYQPDGESLTLYRREARVGHDFQHLHGYFAAKADLKSVAVVLRLRGSGRYEIESPRLDHYVTLPLSPETASVAEAVRAAAPPFAVRQAPADIPAARPWRRIIVDQPAATYLSHWSKDAARAAVEKADGGLRFELDTDPEAAGGARYGGIAIPVAGVGALRLTLSFEHPENINMVVVDGYGERRTRVLRWARQVTPTLGPLSSTPTALTLMPGQPTEFWLPNEADAAAVNELHVFIRAKAGSTCGFTLHSLEVAGPAEAPDPP